jgi:hypothetical protein
MAKGFLNVASIFKFYLIESPPSGIAKHARVCMQFADSAGNIGDGTLIQTTLFCTSRIFLILLQRSIK